MVKPELKVASRLFRCESGTEVGWDQPGGRTVGARSRQGTTERPSKPQQQDHHQHAHATHPEATSTRPRCLVLGRSPTSFRVFESQVRFGSQVSVPPRPAPINPERAFQQECLRRVKSSLIAPNANEPCCRSTCPPRGRLPHLGIGRPNTVVLTHTRGQISCRRWG